MMRSRLQDLIDQLRHQILASLPHQGVIDLGLGQKSDPDGFHLQP